MRTGFKTALPRNRFVVISSLSIWIIFSLTSARVVDSAVFNCSSGDVTCLIAAINEANGLPGEHIINLAPGTYTLQEADNETDGRNGLPSIKSSIHIRASSEDEPPKIETNRDPSDFGFRIFHVSANGKLNLEGLILQLGLETGRGGAAVFNRGGTWLRDSVVMLNFGEPLGAIANLGTLKVFGSIFAHNGGFFGAAALNNELGANALLDQSTFFGNGSDGEGAIDNNGSLVVRNSSIIFNSDEVVAGGINNHGSAQIVNSTIAQNQGSGVINYSDGRLSITNSTIRENVTNFGFSDSGGIVNVNFAAPPRIQNTIIAGNIGSETNPDCAGVFSSLGNNFIGDPSGCTINLQASDLTGDPGLGPLIGTEEDVPPGRAIYPVLAGSAVIDRANSAACPETDQLGNPRIGACDIGAMEFSSSVPAIVNNLVSFVPLTATFKTSSDTVDCPIFSFVGKFSFDARLTNTTKGVTLSNLILRITTLTNGNFLKRADGIFVRGGGTLKVTKVGGFSDGLLSQGEFVDQPFTICLNTTDRFSFFVDVLGIESDTAANSMALK